MKQICICIISSISLQKIIDALFDDWTILSLPGDL
jgi:hypothetical protein